MESHNKSSIIAVWFYTDQQYSASVKSREVGFQAPPQKGGPLNVFLPGGLGKNTLHNSTHLLVLKARVTTMPPSCTHVQSTHGHIQELRPF